MSRLPNIFKVPADFRHWREICYHDTRIVNLLPRHPSIFHSHDIIVSVKGVDSNRRFFCNILFPFLGDDTLDDEVQKSNAIAVRLSLNEKQHDRSARSFVLRRIDSKWRLIGDAYVYGIIYFGAFGEGKSEDVCVVQVVYFFPYLSCWRNQILIGKRCPARVFGCSATQPKFFLPAFTDYKSFIGRAIMLSPPRRAVTPVNTIRVP